MLLGERRQVHRIDDAMMADRRVQPRLEDVDPKDYARLTLSVVRRGVVVRSPLEYVRPALVTLAATAVLLWLAAARLGRREL